MPDILRRATRYGVGKDIGGAVYVHRQYQPVLGPAVEAAAACLPPGFEYTVVKVTQRTGVVSFIHQLDGQLDAAPPEVDALDDPQWIAIRCAIFEALDAHPDARLAIANRLRLLESDQLTQQDER